MLSVLIETGNGEGERLARTLASLVPAVVAGAVREVLVIAREDAAEVLTVAEHAGCGIADNLAGGVAAAKSDWLLLLEPGARPLDDWFESALDHASPAATPARLTPAHGGLRAVVAAWRSRRRPFRHGLLISRAKMREAIRKGAGTGGLVSSRRLCRLSGRIAVSE